MRFLYCACATSYILNDWTGLNRDLAVSYIKSSLVIYILMFCMQADFCLSHMTMDLVKGRTRNLMEAVPIVQLRLYIL